jgi:hypothetical protein
VVVPNVGAGVGAVVGVLPPSGAAAAASPTAAAA